MHTETDAGPLVVALMLAAYFAGLLIVHVGSYALMWAWSVISV